MSEHMSVRDAPWTWKKRIDPRKVRGTYPFQSCEERIQTCSNLHGPRCDEDYSCRHKTSCQNQLPQLQGGHVSHKTFSKSTPHQLQGGHCPTKRSLRAPLQCVPVKIQEIKIKTKCHSCRGGTSPTKRQIEFLCSLKSTPPVCQNQRNQIQKPNASWPTGATNLGAFNSRMYNVPRISRYVQDNEKLPPAHRTWRALRRHRTSWVPEAPEPASTQTKQFKSN